MLQIDADYFPHILSAVVNYASAETLLTLRLVSREVGDMANARLFEHIAVVDMSPDWEFPDDYGLAMSAEEREPHDKAFDDAVANGPFHVYVCPRGTDLLFEWINQCHRNHEEEDPDARMLARAHVHQQVRRAKVIQHQPWILEPPLIIFNLWKGRPSQFKIEQELAEAPHILRTVDLDMPPRPFDPMLLTRRSDGKHGPQVSLAVSAKEGDIANFVGRGPPLGVLSPLLLDMVLFKCLTEGMGSVPARGQVVPGQAVVHLLEEDSPTWSPERLVHGRRSMGACRIPPGMTITVVGGSQEMRALLKLPKAASEQAFLDAIENVAHHSDAAYKARYPHGAFQDQDTGEAVETYAPGVDGSTLSWSQSFRFLTPEAYLAEVGAERVAMETQLELDAPPATYLK